MFHELNQSLKHPTPLAKVFSIIGAHRLPR
jgi:hypothetical protein